LGYAAIATELKEGNQEPWRLEARTWKSEVRLGSVVSRPALAHKARTKEPSQGRAEEYLPNEHEEKEIDAVDKWIPKYEV
jgi:hypothetical protein